MLNFYFYPNADDELLKSPFYEHFERIISKYSDMPDAVSICVLRDYLTYFPNSSEGVYVSYFENQREVQEQKKVNALIADAKDLDLKFRINHFLQDTNLKIFIFVDYPNKISEEQFINSGLSHQQNEKSNNSKNEEQHLNVVPIQPKYKLEQMVLDDDTKKAMDHCITLIKNIDIIYNDWGFSEVDPVQKTVINFYGPSGTGKTMAAHVIANEIGRKILPINYAEIESKYVGDAPKNLISVFDIAKKENAVLFFDEADSFLGKRITNVSSSSDQAVNSLRSQMLILLESYDITVIFATNLNENYDKAFNSRILESIKFNLPNKELRKNGIKKTIPLKVPKTSAFNLDGCIDKISEISDGFSFREIKNAVLSALVECSRLKTGLTNEILENSFVEKKNEIESISSDKKKELSAKIKQKLDNGEYTIHRREENKVKYKKSKHKRR